MRRRGFAVVALAITLAGCATTEVGTPQPVPQPPRQAPRSSAVASPAPSTPAVGSDPAACAGANCAINVGPGTAIPLPASTGVKNLVVRTVTGDRVTLTGQDTGNDSSSACYVQCDSTDTDGSFTIVLGPDGRDDQNSVSITVEGFGGGRVVLRFEPIT